MFRSRLALVGVLLLSGCRTPPLHSVDRTIADLASHPFDEAPATVPKPTEAPPKPAETRPPGDGALQGAAWPSRDAPRAGEPAKGVVPVSFNQVERGGPGQVAPPMQKFELQIPREVPGSETPLVKLPRDPAERDAAIARIFPKLEPLPDEPVPLPGPNGHPLTLAELQRIAAANSPALRQAAFDIEAARGIMKQAGTYPNPIFGVEAGPNANNTATGTQGVFVDQVIKTGGKLRIQAAAAAMDLRNAELALKRARSDLSTQVRTAYYNLLVARETVRVTKSLAHFTDEIYRLQADMLGGGFAASHEPAALWAQSFTVRLAYKQAIANYVYAWKPLVNAIGLRQLPLSEVEGQVDQLIPYFDYDAVLAHILRNHTDILTARSTIQKARYNLKFAQVTPVPDVDVRFDVWKENTVGPFQQFHALSIGIPFPVWDQNKGNIRAAAAGLGRAAEGPHQVEISLTSGLASAYGSYKTNLAAIEYYRRDILPYQVQYYRGVFERRRVDPNASFGDLVQAQQTLTGNVTTYLGLLGQLWTSVVGVADFLQTDDLYQLGKPRELPPLPDLESLHAWPCPHPQLALPPAVVHPVAPPVPPAGLTTAPPPTTGEPIEKPTGAAAAPPVAVVPISGRTADSASRKISALGSAPPVSNSTAAPPVAQSSGALIPDLSRRSGAASL